MAKSLHAPRYNTVPAFLKKMRRDADLTQQELAKLLKIPQVTVSKIERKERRVDISEFIDWVLACGQAPDAALRTLMKFRRGDVDTK